MDLFHSLLHLSAIHILMAMVPGPNTVVVGHCSASMSRRAGAMAACGVAVASLIWVSLSLLGVGALLMQAGEVYRILRLLGAGYLVYVGVRMLRLGSGTGAAALPLYGSPFLAGFLTTLSNPKSAAFWTSVFVLLLPAHAPAWFYAAVLGVIALQALGWYMLVAMALSSAFSRKYLDRLTITLSCAAGGVMILLGLRIADDVRREIAARAI